MIEIWKDIEGYEGRYKVSNTGKVYSITTNREMATSNNTSYLGVTLYKDGKPKFKLVHRLVAQAFIPNPENKPEVNHIDHNTHNNNIANLEWVTKDENYFAYKKFIEQKGETS